LDKIALSQRSSSFAEKWLAQKEAYDTFPKRLAQYRKEIASPERKADAQKLAAWTEQYHHLKDEWELYERIISHIRDDLETLATPNIAPQVEKVWWRFLPSGEGQFTALAAAVAQLKKSYPDLKIDETRLHFAQSLSPTHIFVGEDEFEGYFAFVFDRSTRVLLDNPIEGNAAYIFLREWKELSRHSKTYLLRYHGKEVGRVIHNDTGLWKARVKHLLRV
jgi:hypothetical protein